MRLDAAWEELTDEERETIAASMREEPRPRAFLRLSAWRAMIPDVEKTWRTKFDTYNMGPLQSAIELRLPIPNWTAMAWVNLRLALQRVRLRLRIYAEKTP